MMQVITTLVALQTAHASVRLAKQYAKHEAVNDTAQAIVELLRTLHNNNFDVQDLAQQAVE